MSYWITVVDDDAMSMANTKDLLTAQGMHVSCLRSGENFMKFIKANNPDLVLLDIMMPGEDGFMIYHRLRDLEKQEGREPVPVIFLSGENPTETEPYGLKIGADDYIVKPCDPVILKGRIERAIGTRMKIKGLVSESELDKLTGFLNKTAGTQKTAELCGTKAGALLIIDIDNFKSVNDLYGHETGDKVLVLFSETLRRNTRADDVICRVGGDEFMAFFPNIPDEEKAAAVVKRVSDRFTDGAKRLLGNDHDIPLGISVGVALTPIHSTNFETLFRYADSTMYKVKKNGKHGFAVYDPYAPEGGSCGTPDKELDRLMQIAGERGTPNEPMILGQDAFIANYRFIMRSAGYRKEPVSLILFTLGAADGGRDISAAAETLGAVLREKLRICDIIMQSRADRFVLLLPDTSEQNAAGIAESIMTALKKNHTDAKISCHTKTISF